MTDPLRAMVEAKRARSTSAPAAQEVADDQVGTDDQGAPAEPAAPVADFRQGARYGANYQARMPGEPTDSNEAFRRHLEDVRGH